MKKIILILILFLNGFSLLNAQTQTIGNTIINRGAKGDKGDDGAGSLQTAAEVVYSNTTSGLAATELQSAADELKGLVDGLSSGSANPNITVTNNLTEFNAALLDANSKIEVRGDIQLTGNLTIPDDKELLFTTGKITHNGYVLTGTNTKWIPNGTDVSFDTWGSQNAFAGTWNTPKTIFATNFGTRRTGTKLETGSITAGQTTFTDADASFTSADIGKFIAIIGAGGVMDTPPVNVTWDQGYVHRTTITSINSSTSVEVADAAITTATDQIFVYGWDDFEAIWNGSWMRNQQPGTYAFPPDREYWYRTVLTETLHVDYPLGWVLGDGTDNVHWDGAGSTLNLIPHEIVKSRAIRIYNTRNSSIKNFKSYGDYKYYKSWNGKDEGSHFINAITGSDQITIQNNKIIGFIGDAITGGGDSQFTNYIKGTGVTQAGKASGVIQGYVDELGVIDAGNTEYWMTDTMLPLTGFQFDKARALNDGDTFFQLTGSSFAGWAGLKTPYFYAVLYNANGDFVERTALQEHYDQVWIKDPTVTQVHIVFPTPPDPTLINLQVRPDIASTSLYIYDNELAFCGRQGISNASARSRIIGNYIHDISGSPLGPCAGIDIEDGNHLNRDIVVEGNYFRNNWSDVTYIGTVGIRHVGNFHLRNTRDMNIEGAPTQTYNPAIACAYGKNAIIEGNFIQGKSVTLDRDDIFVNNRMFGGLIAYTANDNEIRGNNLVNVSIKHEDGDADRVGYPTLIQDNTFSYNDVPPTGFSWWRDNAEASIVKNNRFKLNDISLWSSSADQSDITITSSDFGFFIRTVQTEDLGGYWENNEYGGTIPVIGDRDSGSFEGFPLTDYKVKTKIDHAVGFQNGLPVDYTLEDFNSHWIRFLLNDFENTIISTTPIITFKRGSITIDSRYNWTASTPSLLRTPVKNVGFEFYDFTFDLQVASGVTSITDRFFDFDHLGTTLFDNCTFKSVTAKVIDFTNTNKYPANLGAITIVDPILDGISFTLRAGDKLRFTRPHPDMPVYADNAAAISDGYNVVGDVYRTATGDIKTTY